MHLLPKSLQTAIGELSRLPGVGSRTAERYALHLLKMPEEDVQAFSQAVSSLHKGIATCPKTFALIDSDRTVSFLYEDPNRDKQTVAVVEDYLDVIALEKTGSFHGTYHVLGGALSPIDGVGPEQLTISALIDRIAEDSVTELIIATNASVEGELTATYLNDQLTAHQKLDSNELTITRLARGIPAGIDLEYADQITLNRALTDRKAFS